MLLNYQRYSELVFVDVSVRKTARQNEFGPPHGSDSEGEDVEVTLHLVVLSGLNSEGQNVLFGAGVLHQIEVESMTWLLH